MSETSMLIFLFLFGSVIGSFLNVCIVRIPGKMSIVLPASHCPACKKPISWYDNIPLCSYILLGGRCRYCKASISLRYFIVELLTPCVLVVLYLWFGLSWALPVAFAFSAALIVVTFIDLQHQIIPDVITLPGIVLCFACSFFVPWSGPVQSLVGILVGGGVLYLFAAGYELLTKKEGMGGGDIKLLAMIGAFLGWKGALVSLILGALTGSIIGILVMLLRGKNLKYAIPFGPFLSFGAFCGLLSGEQLIYLYLALGRQ